MQANQGHQKGPFHNQISPSLFGLLKGDESDFSIFRMIIFGFLLFLLYSS
jgi:hypothetical protein